MVHGNGELLHSMRKGESLSTPRYLRNLRVYRHALQGYNFRMQTPEVESSPPQSRGSAGKSGIPMHPMSMHR